MSLKEEERKVLVNMELEKSERLLSELDSYRQLGYWSTLANRVYYTLFHAVSALLINDAIEVGSHKGAAIRFQQYFIKTGVFSREEGRFYAQMQTLREQADYNCAYEIGEEEIVPKIAPTKELIEKIKQYIENKQ
ncbi:MAG: HEPN domain-containing protein [Prevotella sp.]|nr:HEPN domain-containing protein [Prevotella sp.]MBQ8701339.1 HEPN domain-containing protein [Prevotella sp.]